MVDLHTRWLREAGATVDEGTVVEISPLFAPDVEQLRQKIDSGLHIRQPTYFV